MVPNVSDQRSGFIAHSYIEDTSVSELAFILRMKQFFHDGSVKLLTQSIIYGYRPCNERPLLLRNRWHEFVDQCAKGCLITCAGF
jgi:hypothetical protein